MEESTEDNNNQTNDRYSMNFSSPIKYEKETLKTQPEDIKDIKKRFFALGNRNILISSSPKLNNESSVDDISLEKEVKQSDIIIKSPNNKPSNHSVSDLDSSLSVDLHHHNFPAQNNIQMTQPNDHFMSDPHQNLNHIFVGLDDKEEWYNHIKNAKSDMMVNEVIKNTFDELLRRKEEKEYKVKSQIEDTKKKLLSTFYTMDTTNNSSSNYDRLNTQPVGHKEILPIIYEKETNDNYHEIKDKYKKEREECSAIFKSDDLRVSKTDEINLKESKRLMSPMIESYHFDNIILNEGDMDDIYEDDALKSNRRCVTNIIDSNYNNKQEEIKKIQHINDSNLKVEKGEVLNFITKPMYAMVKAAKVSIETKQTYHPILNTSNTKGRPITALSSTTEKHIKSNSAIPSYNVKSVRQLNIKLSKLHNNNSKPLLSHNTSIKPMRLTTLPSTKNPKKITSIIHTSSNARLRNNSQPSKPKEEHQVLFNKEETIKAASSVLLKYTKKTDKPQLLQYLTKANKEGCYVIAVNKSTSFYSSNITPKKDMYTFKGLYRYINDKDQLQKLIGGNDCVTILKGVDARQKIFTLDNPQKKIELPFNNSLLILSNNNK